MTQPALEPQKRALLVEALAAGANVSAAARAAGYSREHVSRLLSRDPTIREEADRRQRAAALVPELVPAPDRPAGVAPAVGAALPVPSQPGGELAGDVLEACRDGVQRLRAIVLLDVPDAKVMDVQVRAAKVLADLAVRPRPTGKAVLASADGRTVQVEAQGDAAGEAFAKLVAKLGG